MSFSTPRLAAVRYPAGRPVDGLMTEVVERIRGRGMRVAGALQADTRDADGCCGPMRLRSLADGHERVISQNLGRHASGCRLDPQALADAAGILMADLEAGPDLMVLNRFGKAEVDGGGLRAVIERAVETGTPLILSVREDYVDAWTAFHGGFADDLPADVDGLVDWCTAAVAPRKAA